MDPALKKDVNVLEVVQYRFTNCISGLRHKPYNECLSELHALTLENQRTLADICTVYKLLHQKIKCTAADVGLTLRHTITLEVKVFTRAV